jgi:hypothetical protein
MSRNYEQNGNVRTIQEDFGPVRIDFLSYILYAL